MSTIDGAPKSRELRRVVITGVGLITPLGRRFDVFSENVVNGRSAIRTCELSDRNRPILSVPLARIDDFDPSKDLPNAKSASMDRATQFVVYAARNAMKDADSVASDIDEVVIGTATSGIGSLEDSYDRLYRGSGRIPPLTIPKSMSSATACATCIDLGITAPSSVLASACGSSNQSIILAAQKIRYGIRDRMLVGGTEAGLIYSNVSAWHQMRVLAPDTCRPFCKTRKGLVLGEGAVVFVIEDMDSANKRDAPILAEIAGWGENTDSGSLTTPQPDGIASAIHLALLDAALNPDEIDLVNAHGTGTELNDQAEAAALEAVFGEMLNRVSVRSTKSLHGHLLGAAGAIELAASIAAMRAGIVPPSVNHVCGDPEIAPAQSEVPKARPIRHLLSQSFAFGGHNSVLAIRNPSASHLAGTSNHVR